MNMEIKCYEDKYRDDMIFMVLQAKDALGRIPRINEDLLDIRKHYYDRGDLFWIAVDKDDRVIGCGGYSRIEGTNEAFLHRLYVKASEKRKGIGSALLETIEAGMRDNSITTARVHLGDPPEQWFESYSFYPKHGYAEYAPRYMVKELSAQIPLYEEKP
ncbi:MAG: GNAT family N-acetyltransferase [Oscillospiraceae bacterium]|nr:GNAT family N-acetyltransferase [Oscillospiraceae bacterium]